MNAAFGHSNTCLLLCERKTIISAGVFKWRSVKIVRVIARITAFMYEIYVPANMQLLVPYKTGGCGVSGPPISQSCPSSIKKKNNIIDVIVQSFSDALCQGQSRDDDHHEDGPPYLLKRLF